MINPWPGARLQLIPYSQFVVSLESGHYTSSTYHRPTLSSVQYYNNWRGTVHSCSKRGLRAIADDTYTGCSGPKLSLTSPISMPAQLLLWLPFFVSKAHLTSQIICHKRATHSSMIQQKTRFLLQSALSTSQWNGHGTLVWPSWTRGQQSTSARPVAFTAMTTKMNASYWLEGGC